MDELKEFDPIAYINEPRWQESRLGLERTVELLERMGRPQDRLRFVHVAGTNGKGSTCAYIASVLQAAGFKTGLFTSPYIIEFAERIRVDGANISPDDLRDVTLFVREHAEAMAEAIEEHPTEFELMTAVAFEHFARMECDIVVCEVGLGGRLDSTNVIDPPEVCVIARIGLDHTDFLGDTVEAVAGEKAGIIKRGTRVVSWPQEEGAQRVIDDVARELGVVVSMPDFDELFIGAVEGGVRAFTYRGVDYTTKLLGSYQPSNAALALEAVSALKERGWNIPDEAVRRGIADTAWPGRFEIVSAGDEGHPTVIVDGGHNPQGAAVLAESLRNLFEDRRIVFVMSVLGDKDYRGMIAEVAPLASAFVCATPPNPRALASDELASAIREAVEPSVPVCAVADFSQAIEQAREYAGPSGTICIFGSLYSIGDIKQALEGLL